MIVAIWCLITGGVYKLVTYAEKIAQLRPENEKEGKKQIHKLVFISTIFYISLYLILK